MSRRRRCVIASRGDQFATTQTFESGLDGALGKAGGVGKGAQTCRNRFPLIARRLAIKMEVYQIRGWLLIVTNQIAHENVENVVVHCDDCFKPWHDVDLNNYTDKRTALSSAINQSHLDANMSGELISCHHDQANQVCQHSGGRPKSGARFLHGEARIHHHHRSTV